MARTIAKDHDQKRSALLGQAARFFADHGYDAASMGKLAAFCGVSKALIYHYYRSKEALLFDIVHSHLRDLHAQAAAAPLSGAAEVDLRALVQAILEAYRDADAEHKLQLNAIGRLPESDQKALAAIQRDLVQLMAQRIKALAPDAFAARPEKLKPITMSVFGMLNWFYMWYRKGSGLSRAAYGDLVADLVLGGVHRALGGDVVAPNSDDLHAWHSDRSDPAPQD